MRRPAEHPLPARLTVRVGVTGHRPSGLQCADDAVLRASIRGVLESIIEATIQIRDEAGDLYTSEKPLLRLISPLAEGADRLVAEEALKLQDDRVAGFQLQCPLPFPREEYIKDFPSTVAEFDALLEQADAVLELDGPTAQSVRSEAYLAVGRVVLRQCDLLLAIWDGGEARGGGGTGQVVQEAISIELPTIWIRSYGVHDACLLRSWPQGEAQHDPPSSLARRLRGSFVPQAAKAADQHATHGSGTQEVARVRRYFKERQPERTLGFVFKLLRDVGAGRWDRRPLGFVIPKGKTGKEREWTPAWQALMDRSPDLGAELEERYLHDYEWSDSLAEFYVGKYRSSFVVSYLFGAVAVLAAFIGLETHQPSLYFAELVLIGIIVTLTWLGRRQCWHERWMDYRLLAESLRQIQFLDLIGRVPASFKVPVYLEIGDPRRSWSNWYFRSLVRQAGLMNARLDPSYLKVYRGILEESIKAQIKYHAGNHEVFKKLHRRAHKVAEPLFWLAGAACLVHLVLALLEIHPWRWVETMLNLLAIVFPGFGAALGAILHHGEFERIALRSQALEARLRSLADDLAAARPSSQDLGRIAETFSDMTMAELLDWRFAFLGKNLVLPA